MEEVKSPTSSPVMPFSFKAAVASEAAGIRVKITISFSTYRKGSVPAPRFFATVDMASFCSGVRLDSSKIPLEAPLSKSERIRVIRGLGCPDLGETFFSLSMARTPSFVREPKALPISFCSTPRAFAKSVMAKDPFSATRLIIFSSTVPRAWASRPKSVIS